MINESGSASYFSCYISNWVSDAQFAWHLRVTIIICISWCSLVAWNYIMTKTGYTATIFLIWNNISNDMTAYKLLVKTLTTSTCVWCGWVWWWWSKTERLAKHFKYVSNLFTYNYISLAVLTSHRPKWMQLIANKCNFATDHSAQPSVNTWISH